MNIKSYLLMAALVGTAIPNAQAVTVVESDSHGPARTTWNQNLIINQFDPSLGNLISVTVDFTSIIQSNGTVQNNDAQEQTVTVTVNADVTMDMAAGLSGGSMAANVSANRVFPNMQPGEVGNVSISDSGADSRVYTQPADLAIFTGNGTLTFPASADSTANTGSSANVGFNILTDAGVTLQVTYEYGAPTQLTCQNSINAQGDSVVAILNGGESCGNVQWTEVINCTGGDLTPVVNPNPAGCTITQNPAGTFTATCSGTIPANGMQVYGALSSIDGTEGTCTSQVTAMSCVTTSTSTTLTADTSACSGQYSIIPPPSPRDEPPPNVPTLSQWGLVLLAGLLGMAGFRASRRRS